MAVALTTRALRAGFNLHVPEPIEPAERLPGLASLSPHDSVHHKSERMR
jgi:hypothetical protein